MKFGIMKLPIVKKNFILAYKYLKNIVFEYKN